jgi:NTE family protein
MNSPENARTEMAIPAKARRVLVLQGGGALGSYQAGAYQALCHHDFEPEWIAGISIGAINAAIIAGNAPEHRVARLKEFWKMASAPVPWQPMLTSDDAHSAFDGASAAYIMAFGVPGFFTPRFPPAQFFPSSDLASMSYYDTAPLRETLLRLVDFNRINSGLTRFSVGAVNVATGNLDYFDNTSKNNDGSNKYVIGPEHIMASGALPPGFPAVRIGDDYYWDGGIASNTPLDYVLQQETRDDLLIFQVDLFSARGPLPGTLLDAAEREKDIRFSSRTRMNTDKNKTIHNAIKAIGDLLGKLPEELNSDPSVVFLKEVTKENMVTVIHLIYRSKLYESSSKDYNFSRLNMVDHWQSGERDLGLAMRHTEWFERPQNGETMVTHDLTEEDYKLLRPAKKASHETGVK